MKYEVKTANSTYVLDDVEMTWERVCTCSESGHLRTDGGDLVVFPDIDIGDPLILLGSPITPGTDGRIVMTSPVERVAYPC